MEESRLFKGFTKVPNHLLNTVMKCQFSGVELKLILAIWRYTNGFSRDSAELSLNFLAGEIGSCARVVSRQMKRLIDMNVVQVRYVNQKGVRSYAINDNVESWQTQKKPAANNAANHDQMVWGGTDQTVIPAINQMVRGTPTKWSGELSTKWSSNKDNINIILYKKIKERVFLPEKLDQAFEKWLEYKTERGDKYGEIPLTTLVATVKEKAKYSGEDEVIRVIDECIASNYKNIIWEKLRKQESKRDLAGEFLADYDHQTLERMSRGKRND
ncbi:MAG: hypothetical protein E7417_03795 [Ruminococcaceae bacterium]|nr:hypothetical protein [Oscillospiraceae bacterium]